MSDLGRDDPRLLINAAIDGELDAAGEIDIERRLADDPKLASEHGRLLALQTALRGLPREKAPERLRARILAMAPARAPSRSAARSKSASCAGSPISSSVKLLRFCA